jgi:hypothetical protein
LGRFDDAAQQFVEPLFVGSGYACSFGLGDEISQPVEPDGFVEG